MNTHSYETIVVSNFNRKSLITNLILGEYGPPIKWDMIPLEGSLVLKNGSLLTSYKIGYICWCSFEVPVGCFEFFTRKHPLLFCRHFHWLPNWGPLTQKKANVLHELTRYWNEKKFKKGILLLLGTPFPDHLCNEILLYL